jgi:hypothetical protein
MGASATAPVNVKKESMKSSPTHSDTGGGRFANGGAEREAQQQRAESGDGGNEKREEVYKKGILWKKARGCWVCVRLWPVGYMSVYGTLTVTAIKSHSPISTFLIG